MLPSPLRHLPSELTCQHSRLDGFKDFKPWTGPEQGTTWTSGKVNQDQSLPSAKAVGPVPGDSHIPCQNGFRAAHRMCHSTMLVGKLRWCLLRIVVKFPQGFPCFYSAGSAWFIHESFIQSHSDVSWYSIHSHLSQDAQWKYHKSMPWRRLARTLWPRHGRMAAEPGSGQQVLQNNCEIVLPTFGNNMGTVL